MFELVALETQHAQEVSELIREGFEVQLHPFLPYCQFGTAAALKEAVSECQSVGRLLMTAMTAQGEVACFADVRLTESVAFLSYIVVRPSLRGTKVAERMINELTSLAEHRTWELEVFAHNLPAATLYRRMGFTEASSSHWYVHDAGTLSTDESTILLSKEKTDESLHKYGFGYIEAQIGSEVVRFGLPSNTVIRTPDRTRRGIPGVVLDAYPKVKFALRTPPALEPGAGRHVASSIRLRRDNK